MSWHVVETILEVQYAKLFWLRVLICGPVKGKMSDWNRLFIVSLVCVLYIASRPYRGEAFWWRITFWLGVWEGLGVGGGGAGSMAPTPFWKCFSGIRLVLSIELMRLIINNSIKIPPFFRYFSILSICYLNISNSWWAEPLKPALAGAEPGILQGGGGGWTGSSKRQVLGIFAQTDKQRKSSKGG